MDILIQGYYGVENLGDDYLLLSILNSLKKIENGITNIRILCQGNRVCDILEEFDSMNIDSFIIRKNSDYFKYIAQFDEGVIYILGGGGLFPKDSIKSYLKTLFIAIYIKVIMKGKFLIYGVDLCRVKGIFSKAIWKMIVHFSDLIIFRNNYSKNIIASICNSDHIYGLSDITYSLDNDVELDSHEIAELLCRIECSDNNYIIWVLAMPFDNEELKNETIKKRYNLLVEQISSLINSYKNENFINLFLPFFRCSDISIIQDVTSKLCVKYRIIENDVVPLEKKRALFHNARCVVSMRFHGVAFALKYGKPVLAVSYSPKTSEMMKECGLEDYVIDYGIREDSTLFVIKDLDYDELKKKTDKIVYSLNNLNFENASTILIKKAQHAEDLFLECITKMEY